MIDYISEADARGFRRLQCDVCKLIFEWTPSPPEQCHHRCSVEAVSLGLSPDLVALLFPKEEDPTLLGNRIKALTTAIGIPSCTGCEKRRQWINDAHVWIRHNLTTGNK